VEEKKNLERERERERGIRGKLGFEVEEEERAGGGERDFKGK
jgi:hypothetical protein